MRKFLALTLIAVMGLSVIGIAQPGSSPDEPIYMLLVPSTEGATPRRFTTSPVSTLFPAFRLTTPP